MEWSQLPLLNCSQNEDKPWPKAQEMTEKTLFHPHEIGDCYKYFEFCKLTLYRSTSSRGVVYRLRKKTKFNPRKIWIRWYTRLRTREELWVINRWTKISDLQEI